MANRNVSVGVHVPSVAADALPSGEAYAAFFRELEALGLDAVWTEDRVFHRSPMLDSLTVLTWAAANTTRVRLGTAVLLLNLRNAAVLARQAAAMQHLSGGRLELGVSLGGRDTEYAAIGQDIARRVPLFNESLSTLKALLGGEPVDREGRFFQLRGALVKPAQRVPLYVGGRVEAVLRRAGAHSDGWIMGPFGDLAEFERSWRVVRQAASAAGRDPEALTAGRLIYVAIDPDRAVAKRNLGDFLHAYYPPELDIDTIGIYGPAAEVARRLREQVDAGITQLMLGLPSLDSLQLHRLAEEVAPALRA